MLKAAVVEPEPGAVGANISLDYMEDAKWSLHVKRIIRREGVRTYFDRVFAAKFPLITWKDKVTVCYEVLLGISGICFSDRAAGPSGRAIEGL